MKNLIIFLLALLIGSVTQAQSNNSSQSSKIVEKIYSAPIDVNKADAQTIKVYQTDYGNRQSQPSTLIRSNTPDNPGATPNEYKVYSYTDGVRNIAPDKVVKREGSIYKVYNTTDGVRDIAPSEVIQIE